MKKFIMLSLLFIPMVVLAADETALQGFDEPQWKDFAPVAYKDVQEPKGLAKFNDVVGYWYKRRVEFDKGIEKCREIEKADDKIACYQELKVKQYQKNNDYNARIEAMERQKMNPQEMQDPTSNMYPLGGIIDTFTKFQPNEMR